jgi:hypothetical protein
VHRVGYYTQTEGRIYNKIIQLLAYAIDIAKRLMKAVELMGLVVNVQKIKYRKVTIKHGLIIKC